MSLQLNPSTGKITYKGNEVGERVFKEGRYVVQLSIEFESSDDWIVPLSWFAFGLATLPENQPAPTLLTVETSSDSIADKYDGARYLIEKDIKSGGYVWRFHKTDPDSWPSPLHGHDYEHGLKLDAITGKIYNVITRQPCMTLKSKDLQSVQSDLRESKDFKDAVSSLVDNTSATSEPSSPQQ